MDEVFTACMAHWLSANPRQTPVRGWRSRARGQSDPGADDAYRRYDDAGSQLHPVYGDIESVPPSSRLVIETRSDPAAASSSATICQRATLAKPPFRTHRSGATARSRAKRRENTTDLRSRTSDNPVRLHYLARSTAFRACECRRFANAALDALPVEAHDRLCHDLWRNFFGGGHLA